MSPSPALSQTLRGMLWMLLSGLLFSLLNTALRAMALQLDPFETQFLRYLLGTLVMLPLVLRAGWRAYHPKGLAGQLWRGVVHTAGLLLFFTALPRIPLAEVTAIGFTTPIFVMLGAAPAMGERLRPARWAAAAAGLAGVLIVVGPSLSGGAEEPVFFLAMLGSAPLFAASYLISKALTRRDRPEVIVVWQSLTVSLFSLPFALPGWVWPDASQWGWLLFCGLVGTAGHYCLTQAFRLADMSATQPIKFLDLVWVSLLGFLVFGDVPGGWTILGGAVIFLSATWIARREARRPVARTATAPAEAASGGTPRA